MNALPHRLQSASARRSQRPAEGICHLAADVITNVEVEGVVLTFNLWPK